MAPPSPGLLTSPVDGPRRIAANYSPTPAQRPPLGDEEQKKKGFWRRAGSYLLETADNFIPSVGQLAVDITEPIRHPIQTYSALKQLATDPEMQSEVWGYLKEQYGGVDNILESFKNNPAGIMSDIGGLFSGGGLLAGKLSGKLSTLTKPVTRAQDMAQRAAETGAQGARIASNVDPLIGIPNAVRLGANKIPELQGLVTGLGPDVFRTALATGRVGGEQLRNWNRIFNDMSATNQAKIVEQARSALNGVREQLRQRYTREMADIAPEIIDVEDIQRALDEVKEKFAQEVVGGGTAITSQNPFGGQLDSMQKMLDELKTPTPGSTAPQLRWTVENVDKLKQNVGALYRTTGQTRLNTPVSDFYNAIKNKISEHAPKYAKIMEDYERTMDDIRLYEGELSLGNKVSDPQAFRRLLSTTRDQVHTNFGGRRDILDQLEETLFPQLAAAATSGMTPTGTRAMIPAYMAAEAGLKTIGGDLTAVPRATAVLGGTSPRLNAQMNLMAGRALTGMENLGQSIQQRVPAPLLDAAQQATPPAMRFMETISRFGRPFQSDFDRYQQQQQFRDQITPSTATPFNIIGDTGVRNEGDIEAAWERLRRRQGGS